MEVGLFFGTNAFNSEDEGAFELVAQRAEELGFGSVWIGDHVAIPSVRPTGYPYSADGRMPVDVTMPMYDPFVTLAAIAAVTKRIKLGTSVYVLALRHPLATARTVASLDRISNGRVQLGVGNGWLKEEFEAVGVPWQKRAQRTEDQIRLLHRLWTEDAVESDSEFYPFAPMTLQPRPTRRIPILVGGESEPALRRAALLGDGWISVTPTPEETAPLVTRLRELRAAEGLQDQPFRIVARLATPTREQFERYAELGVDEVRVHGAVFPDAEWEQANLPDVLAGMERFAERVLPAAA